MSTRTSKIFAPLFIFSLLALTAIPSVNGRPCDSHSSPVTILSTPVYTSTHTQTYQHHHSSGYGQGGPVTKTVTATTTTTDTDTVTQTHTATTYSSPTWSYSGSGSSSSSSFPSISVASAAAPSPTSSSSSSSSSGSGQCNTGPVQCCNSVHSASSLDAASSSLLDSLNISLDDANSLVGLTCSPLSGLGLSSGGTCAGTTVCCNDNSYNGLVNVGCIPIILQL